MADYKIPNFVTSEEFDESQDMDEFIQDDYDEVFTPPHPPDCILKFDFVPSIKDTGMEDKHYFICRALGDFLETHPEFDKTATYKVFKQVHMGRKHGKHFNFEYKDRSCHAYIEECIVNLNGLTQVIGLKIILLTVLEVIH